MRIPFPLAIPYKVRPETPAFLRWWGWRIIYWVYDFGLDEERGHRIGLTKINAPLHIRNWERLYSAAREQEPND